MSLVAGSLECAALLEAGAAKGATPLSVCVVCILSKSNLCEFRERKTFGALERTLVELTWSFGPCAMSADCTEQRSVTLITYLFTKEVFYYYIFMM